MKYPVDDRVELRRYQGPQNYPCGSFYLGRGSATLLCLVSDGGGWDHVSVSLKTRTPTWAELEFVRRAFFKDDETVMQLHVPSSDHINNHDNCLHLWRPQTDEEIRAIRDNWEREGEVWPYGDLQSPGTIPRPEQAMV